MHQDAEKLDLNKTIEYRFNYMDSLFSILEKKKEIKKTAGKKPVNERYEQAKEIGDYIGIPVFVIMRLQKQYGHAKVARLRTFLKDYPNLDKKRAIGLCHWFLKQK